MEGKVGKKSTPLSGVKCVVNTCHYYAEGDHCTAEKIEIQHPNSIKSEDTDCKTFTPEQW